MSANLGDIKLLIQSDDYAAFKELYLTMYVSLIRFAKIYTADTYMAEDVLSDVFLKLWDQRRQIDNIRNLKVYLYTAVKNTSINYRNRQSRIVTEFENLPEQTAADSDPEAAMISSETKKAIHIAVQRLPPRCKLIFQLAKEEGLRYKEIATILGVSIKTIDNQMAIAIQKLGEALLIQQQE